MKSPVRAQGGGSHSREDYEGNLKRPLHAAWDRVGRFTVMDVGGAAAPDTDAAVNSVRFVWFGRHSSILESWGVPRAEPFPATTGFQFGDGRLGEVRSAEETPGGHAGGRCEIPAFVTEADIPATLRAVALGGPWWGVGCRLKCSDFERTRG